MNHDAASGGLDLPALVAALERAAAERGPDDATALLLRQARDALLAKQYEADTERSRYRNLFGDKREYMRGFGYQGGAGRDGWGRAVAELGVGGAFKDRMATPGKWTIGATAFGEMLLQHRQATERDALPRHGGGDQHR